MKTFDDKIKQATVAGFEIYHTTIVDGEDLCILTNTDVNSKYNGETIDIYENGHTEQGSQYKGIIPLFAFINN